jgi:hypothetical protein
MALSARSLTNGGPAGPGADAQTYGAPVFDVGMTFREFGVTGLRQYSGYVRDEFLPALQGRQGARVYREMSDNSATVGALIFSITQTLRKIEWRVNAASDAAPAKAEQEFVESLMHDMSHTWEDFIAEVLSMIAYGYAPHEIVYKRREGRTPEQAGSGITDSAGSAYDDGRLGLRKLPLRSQETVLKWFFGPNGEILGLTQMPYTGGLRDIPIEKLLLFRPSAHKGNPEGRSVLRNSYRSWWFLKRFEEEEAIFFERMSGVPVIYMPQQLWDAAAAGDANATAQIDAYKRAVTNTKIGEQMGLILPSNTWPGASGAGGSSAKMFEFCLVTPSGGRTGIDADKVISRHRLDMLMSVLADFIELGHASHGTQSLAENKVDMFFSAIEGWVNSVSAVLNRYLLPRVWALNALDPNLMPELVPDLAHRIDLTSLGDYIQKLGASGMPLFPDQDLEEYLRDVAGLPEASEETIAAHAAANEMEAASAAAALEAAQAAAKQPPPVPGQPPPVPGKPTLTVVKAVLEAAEERRRRRHTA